MPENSEVRAQDETRLVEQLLGRLPRVPYRVVRRCPGNTPQVLETDPVFLENGMWKPFPTILWLVCPRLRKEISHHEQDRLAQTYSRRLQEDLEFRRAYLDGQSVIMQYRLTIARGLVSANLPAHLAEVLGTTSIAGSHHLEGVKCLHAHVAQELALGNNPIGAELLTRIGPCSATQPCLPMPAGEKLP